MEVFVKRILRAIRLDSQLYEEVEADTGALPQAIIVVLLASLASGIASISRGVGASLLGGAFSSLISWFGWSYIIYFIGTRFFPEPQTRSDYRELLRTIGFASAPGILAIVGIIPGLFSIALFVTSVWMLIAMVIAVRQALDYKSTGRAILVCVIGWIIYGLLNWLLLGILT
ncbi:MAG: YIP1 family protein [Calditrichota bacterium]